MTAGVDFDSVPSQPPKPKPQPTPARGVDFDTAGAPSKGVNFDHVQEAHKGGGVSFDTAGKSAPSTPQAVDPTPPDSAIAKYLPTIAAASKKYGVPTWLLKAVIGQEGGQTTDYRTRESAVNGVGAAGLAQFMPGTAKQYGIDPLKWDQAIDGMAHYLSDLHAQLGSWTRAGAGYNMGGNAAKAAFDSGSELPPETKKYVANITAASVKALSQGLEAQAQAATQAIHTGNARGAAFDTIAPAPRPNAPPLPAGKTSVDPHPQFTNPLAAPIALVGSTISNALDFQRWVAHGLATGVARGHSLDPRQIAAQGTFDPDQQREEQRSTVPYLNEAYHAMQSYHTGAIDVPVMTPYGVQHANIDQLQELVLHGVRGLIDTALDTAYDPLTYETLGAGALFKTLGPKLSVQVMKAVNSTAGSRWIYDQLHWGGELARTRGMAAADTLRGTVLQSRAEGARLQSHLERRFTDIVDGRNPQTGKPIQGMALDDNEKLRVGQALNGELDPSTLSPKEGLAYRQLRTLTLMDFQLRRSTAEAIAFRAQTKGMPADMRNELQAALKAGKRPVIPEPEQRVREAYGEPVPRQRVTDPGPGPDPTKVWQEQTAGLSPQDKALVGKALGDSKEAKALAAGLNPDLQKRLHVIQDALGRKYAVKPGEVTELTPAQRTTYKPTNQAAIERATMLQQRYDTIQGLIDKNVPFRDNYMPLKHYGSEAEGHPEFTVTPGEYYDPRFEHREDFHVTSVNQLQDGFKAMALNANRQRATRVITDSLGDLLDDPLVEKTLRQTFPATGSYRTDKQKFIDGWRALVGYPRAGIVSMTPRHAVNILDLLVNTVPLHEQPRVMKETMQLAAKLFAASPKEYAALTKEGRALGAVSGSFAERKPFFQQMPDWVPGVGGKQVPVLGSIASVNNKLVWAVDDAAKQTYAKMLVRTGEASNLQAGGMAARHLVDYENLSNAQKALRYIAPFGTFRGGIPQAVLGGVGRSPMRAGVIDRLTGGTFYGDKPASGEEGTYYSGPTADVGRGVTSYTDDSGNFHSGPGDFARATMGGAPAMAASGLQDIFMGPTGRNARWATHGQQWLPVEKDDGTWDLGALADYALSGIPEAQTILEAMGIGRFQWKGLASEAARQTTGVTTQQATP